MKKKECLVIVIKFIPYLGEKFKLMHRDVSHLKALKNLYQVKQKSISDCDSMIKQQKSEILQPKDVDNFTLALECQVTF